MSEYAAKKVVPPEFKSLDHTGTLFDPALDDDYDKQLEHIVDTQNIPYAAAREDLGPRREELKPDKYAAPYWTMEEYYEKWLAMMKIMGEVARRASFGVVANYDESIENRYQSELPKVMRGANRNMENGIRAFRHVFGEEDLIAAGFDEQEVRDESNLMFNEMRREFFGHENKSKRDKARRHASKKLEELRHSSHNTAS